MSRHGMQRQRHGPTKNLVEGIGGALVGAAAVLLVRGLLKRRRSADAGGGQGGGSSAAGGAPSPGANAPSSAPLSMETSS